MPPRQLLCYQCGAPRTLDPDGVYMNDRAPLTCFRCGGSKFVADRCHVAADIPRGAWLLTEHDRRLLRSLRIGRASTAAEVAG